MYTLVACFIHLLTAVMTAIHNLPILLRALVAQPLHEEMLLECVARTAQDLSKSIGVLLLQLSQTLRSHNHKKKKMNTGRSENVCS